MTNQTFACEFCDTEQEREQKRVTITRQRNGQWYIFEDVPAWVCPNCGHRYFDADVLEAMEHHIQSAPQDARPVTAWAISLAE